jgi:hypothetical protein
MKRSNIGKAFAAASVAILVMGIAPAAKAANKGCSTASLIGTFVRHDLGTVLLPAAAAGPIAKVGTLTFDGNGAVTGSGVSSQNGNIVQVTDTGTYTVNSDCTGNFAVMSLPGGFTAHYFFVIDDSGSGFQFICTDSGPISIVYSGVARRQFPVGDWRQ